MNTASYLSTQSQLTEAALNRLVPDETVPPVNIHKAMRYSLFAGGKRIRPALCIASAEAVADEVPHVVDVACTLELIHTYSLIHDDLPALDNDDFRRGRPTCHKVFGDAMAILAGDSLLTLAFHVLAKLPISAEVRVALAEELSTASGTVRGMIGGQVHDIEGEGAAPTPELLETIHPLCPISVNTSALLFRSWTTSWMSSSHPKHWARPQAKMQPKARSPFRQCMDWSSRVAWLKPNWPQHSRSWRLLAAVRMACAG
jgi:geranylgeranyl pyrophosphate synthase